jgi:hypothetical protein
VYEFTRPGCKSRYIGKPDRCFYTRIKEHSLDNKSEVFNHIASREHYQHIKSILELYPDEETNPTQTCILSEFIFTNSKIIDRSDHCWCLLLFKEVLAIRRLNPELNHGTKARRTRAHLSGVLVIRDKLDRQNFLVCGQHLRHFRHS